jgi:hypothetical protein
LIDLIVETPVDTPFWNPKIGAAKFDEVPLHRLIAVLGIDQPLTVGRLSSIRSALTGFERTKWK